MRKNNNNNAKDHASSRSASRWFAAWRRRGERPAQDDPADLGTAFGLDLSLHVQPTDLSDAERRALRAASAPLPAGRAHDAGAGAADGAPRRGWVQRLGISRKQAV